MNHESPTKPNKVSQSAANSPKSFKDRLRLQSLENMETDVLNQGDEGAAEEFNKYKSVFNEFQDDTPEFLKRMLDQDLKYSKIQNLIEGLNEIESQAFHAKLSEYYLDIKNIFLYLTSQSTFPTLQQEDFNKFVSRSQLYDEQVLTKEIVDKLFMATKERINNDPKSDEKQNKLNRFEFMEIIVHMGIQKYIGEYTGSQHDVALDKVMQQVIEHNKQVLGVKFRNGHMYNKKVNTFFRKNEQAIKSLFDAFCVGDTKQAITLEECQKLIADSGLKLSPIDVQTIFGGCMMSRIDVLSEQNQLKELSWSEFLVFIATISNVCSPD